MRAHISPAVLAVLVALGAGALQAAPPDVPRRVSPDVLETLRAAPAKEPLRLSRFPLGEGSEADLELTPFRVWAPGARVVLHDGKTERDLPVPDVQYLRGQVSGRPDSLVLLAAGDVLRGFIFLGSRVISVAPEKDVYRAAKKGDPSFVRAVDTVREAPLSFAGFQCSEPPVPPALPEPLAPAAPQAALSSTVYMANIAVDTDYELYSYFGSSGALTTYVSDLFAAASAIYERDVKTRLQVSYLSIWSTSSDPWTVTSGTLNALYEVGDYWHANHAGVSRTTVHFLSKKSLGGGIAWLGVLCYPDFYQSGHWGGGYGVSASLNGSFSTTNPSLYWDILCSTHEIGHNFDSPHTHCYSPSIDHCYASEGGCYSGALCVNGTSDPCNIGTIMSYCHLRSGGYGNITLVFGVVGQASEAVLTTMRTHVETRSHSASCMPEAGAAAASLYTITPCRVLDTRNPTGALGGPALAGSGAQRTFTVSGVCGIPAGATSISTNVTVTAPSATGSLRLFPSGTSAPTSTVINFPAGTTRANNAHVYLSTGAFTVQSDGGSTHFILDVNGYYQ